MTRPFAMRVASLWRYPVKGFSPERQARVTLQPGAYWPGDRLFAVENGPSGFDPETPRHAPKIKYLMLMRQEKLARLTTRYEDGTGVLTVTHEGREAARGNLATAEGCAAVEAFLADYCRDDLRGPPRMLTAPAGHRFTDSRSGFVSLVNLASVAELESRIGAAIDPLRFRANIYVEGLAANAELEWPAGLRLETGRGVVLEMVKRTERCAATNVDPQTGARDMAIPRALMSGLGHADCGVYLRILAGGGLAPGESLWPHAPTQTAGLPLT
jgi:uncharacterized protein